MRRLGAEKPAFETIVAAGPRSALPHARPRNQKASINELLLIDMGSCQDGYMSDMTRMLFLGRSEPKVRSMYDAVLKAQLAAIDAVRAGRYRRTRGPEGSPSAGIRRAWKSVRALHRARSGPGDPRAAAGGPEATRRDLKPVW